MGAHLVYNLPIRKALGFTPTEHFKLLCHCSDVSRQLFPEHWAVKVIPEHSSLLLHALSSHRGTAPALPIPVRHNQCLNRMGRKYAWFRLGASGI